MAKGDDFMVKFFCDICNEQIKDTKYHVEFSTVIYNGKDNIKEQGYIFCSKHGFELNKLIQENLYKEIK